jgi:uncharacterized OB-fold protein
VRAEALAGMRCGECGAAFALPGRICPRCGRDDRLEPCALGPEGTIYSFTIVRVAPEGLEREAPYALGIVDLAGGARVTARLLAEDPDRLAMNARVRLERAEKGVYTFRAL